MSSYLRHGVASRITRLSRSGAGGELGFFLIAGESAENPSQFSAAPSALGYLYQFETALLEYLRRDDPALGLSIEVLDDIALVGEQIELLQDQARNRAG
jgi:hypothetical protein